MQFSDFWKLFKKVEGEYLMKSSDKLTKNELVEVQRTIRAMQEKGMNANKIIRYLQDHNKKLAERYKAERAFYTELKRLDTREVKDAGEYLELHKYRVILSPSACQVCRKKTDNGRRIFTEKDLKKDGYGHYPPFHPNCYCILIPEE